MPWSQTSPMNQKVLFIADHVKGARPVVELCTEYGISRKTAYSRLAAARARFRRAYRQLQNLGPTAPSERAST